MKQSEIRELSVEDIKAAQQKLLLTHAVSQLENPQLIRVNRRTIARLKTELRKREIDDSVAKVEKKGSKKETAAE